jgi:hypothetical protein
MTCYGGLRALFCPSRGPRLRACVRLFGAAFVLLIPLLLDPSGSRQTDQPWTGATNRDLYGGDIRAVIPAGQGKDAESPRLRALKAADDQ